jgi:F420-dependent oxidoreductase-like protein
MRFSLFLPTGTGHEFAGYTDPVAAFDTIREVAVAAEEGGFHALWAPDHFMPFGPGADYVFEVWTTLATLARETSRIRIGQMVTANGYRNPALQAKMASTLDVISGGRVTFGVGAGWVEDEYAAFGYDFPSGPERLRELREALQIIRSMWTEPSTTFEGRYYRTRAVVNQPAGVQTPHVPIMVAGGGEKVTLRLVAEYADYCNVQEPPDEVARKFGILARHCAEVGRDFGTITKTSTGYCVLADTDEEARAQVPPWASMVFPGDVLEYGLIGSLETVGKRIAVWEEAGVDELIVGFQHSTDLDTICRFASEFIR